MKISKSKLETQLKRIRVPQSDIDKILSILKEAESKGLGEEQISIVVHNIITKSDFRADFLRNPWGLIEKVVPGYRSDGELVQ